ncbi:uncharacterized protein RJT20DRAFT_5620 [Scheffersomyces xylosifermentans]|uniref:uncharacterized protein n=1 Tax=Scheffersomyces xylosifermentans TaxID=1304137 RepID=UPI00315D18F9
MSTSAPPPSTQKPAAAKPAHADKFDQEKLLETIKTLQFAWFVGHFVTLISVFYYTLTYIRIFPSTYKLWYVTALLGVIESFGILVYQLVQKNGFNVGLLLKDDNTHYFLYGLLFLWMRPYVLLTLFPFALFSLFHVLVYVKGYILPIFRLENSPISEHIGNFVSKSNTKSIQLASGLEIVTYVWLFFRMLAFRKRSLSPFLAYTVFIKKRFETSVYTRDFFKQIEVHIDTNVNKIGHPTLKNVWVQVKDVFRKIGGFYLVNDYTKEKVN